ncbi:MAG: tyrosine-type recombinase/integrase [Thermoguttaceae bacterium]
MIALWRFGGLRRCCEVLRLRWTDVIWDKSMLRVHSTKTKSERFVPIFPEIMRPLLDCAEQAAVGAEWVIENRCPAYIKRKPDRSGNIKAANLATVFDKICKKAGLPIVPMIGNNMRASCEKDLYSGKYPELRGRVDLIGQILGHSPQVALQYYQRFSTDDFASLVASFKNVSDVNTENKCVNKCVKQEEKWGHLAQDATNGLSETPCFVASATLENTGRNAFYPRLDSNQRPTV